MWPFNRRRCRCGHARRRHHPEWGWTNCTAAECDCLQFRWIKARLYWDFRYRRAQRFHRG